MAPKVVQISNTIQIPVDIKIPVFAVLHIDEIYIGMLSTTFGLISSTLWLKIRRAS